MNINDYINSGILELYVAGQLSETESKEVYDLMLKHPEVLKEVLEIEAAIVKLTASVSPKKDISFNTIKGRLNNNSTTGKVISLNRSKTKWINYSGWAAAAGRLWVSSGRGINRFCGASPAGLMPPGTTGLAR